MPLHTKTRTRRFLLFLSVSALLFALGISELVLRAIGYTPYVEAPVAIRLTPDGPFYQRDDLLGYKHIPGDFTVHLSDRYSWKTTHLSTSRRITKRLHEYPAAPPTPEIWFMGCSFTHGWSLNNEETFPWLIQERHPNANVQNFGIGGHGCLHALLQLRHELSLGRIPHVVFLCYASFHDERNTLLRYWRKTLFPNQKLGPLRAPYARLTNGHLDIRIAKTLYTPWPFNRYSALINALEDTCYRYEDYQVHSQDVSKAIIEDIHALCETHDVTFVLTGIHHTSDTLRVLTHFKGKGYATLDISVDTSSNTYNNLPHDGHPNARANRHFADTITQYLRDHVLLDSQ